MADFGLYDLRRDIAERPEGVYGLADGLLPDMAQGLGYDLADTPNEQDIRNFVGYIAPEKTLQDNIAVTLDRLSVGLEEGTQITSDWAERSGSMRAMHKSFVGLPSIPKEIDAAVFNTAVGRWQERRAIRTLETIERGTMIGRVVILGGTRVMGESEHAYVGEFAKREGRAPTETEFAQEYIRGIFSPMSRLKFEVVDVDSNVGDEIFAAGVAEKPELLDGTVLAVGNAPSAIQVAGQFRQAARTAREDYDRLGDQLYVVGDTIDLALHGEPASTHQNPFTAVGQIARNAVYLHKEAESYK